METGNRSEEPLSVRPQRRTGRAALAAVFGLATLAIGGPVLAESCAGRGTKPQVEAPADGGRDIGDIRKETLERSGAATE